MEQKVEWLKEQLDAHVELRKHLYEKGFLITNADLPDVNQFPFYGNWNVTECGGGGTNS